MSEKQKIIAVDDEPRNLKIIELSLGDMWEIKTAGNGEETLNLLKTYVPDVVLLDIMMPGIDGYEVCRQIRQNPELKFTKVILISGKAMLEERLKGYEIGADDYITKPFISEELDAKVKVFMRLTQAERELDRINANLEEQVKIRTQKLIDAEAKLINAAKMSALGEMAGGVAHEINTPLAILTLNSDMIDDALSEPEVDRDSIRKVNNTYRQTVQRITTIVRGLRNFSRDSTKDGVVPSSIKQIIDDTVSLCQEKIKSRNVILKISPVAENALVVCRPTEISQILLNLIGNSVDAIMNLTDKWIHVDVISDGGATRITVTDSGSGIAPDVAEKIFQPFFTTKDYGSGTGLGLSISAGLAKANGGQLEYDSKGPNTSFVLSLQTSDAIKSAST